MRTNKLTDKIAHTETDVDDRLTHPISTVGVSKDELVYMRNGKNSKRLHD